MEANIGTSTLLTSLNLALSGIRLMATDQMVSFNPTLAWATPQSGMASTLRCARVTSAVSSSSTSPSALRSRSRMVRSVSVPLSRITISILSIDE